MKKVLLLAVAAIVGLGAQAQLQFGGKVGFDMTHFWGDNVEHGMKPSYQAGLVMEYKATPKFAIAPEVVFASQGGHFETSKAVTLPLLGTIEGKTKVTYNTNYVNVPVMLKYYVIPDFSIDFGPQLGINVYSKVTNEVSVNGKGKSAATDLKDYTNTIDFGLGLGGTYNLTENAFIQARYTLGLTPVFKETFSKEAKNGNLQIAFGYKF